jgi:PAS domain S-box-containing protein
LAASPRLVHGLRFVAYLAAGLVVALGASVLVGWTVGASWLVAPVGDVPMAPNTAVMIVLSGLALGCSASRSRRGRRARTALAATYGAIALATLAQDVVGRAFGIDDLLFSHVGAVRPGVPTTAALILVSAALLLLDVRTRRAVSPSELLATGAGAIAWLALGGYAFKAIQFYVWSQYPHPRGMPILASIGLLALALGVLAARPESGAMAILTSPRLGGRVLRRMLIIALSIPALGFAAILGERIGLYKPPGAAIVEGAAGMVAATWIAVAVCASLERTDARRGRLEKESREWRRFFRGASFGAAFATVDDRLGLVNDAFARMHGMTVDELEGQPIADLFPPARRAELEGHLRLGHERGCARGISEHVRKDGSTFPVFVDMSPIHDERGALLYRAAYVQDITREMEAQEARSRLASLVMWAEDAIVAEALDGTVLAWNQGAERIYGYPAREMTGRPATVLLPEDRRSELDALRARALAGEAIVGFETERIRKDAVRIPIALTLSPIRDDGDRVTAISVIARDISALKELERQREEWSSVVAHDLRQPATTIRYATETLARGDDEARRKAVGSIRKASERLERMVADLLDVTRIEAHRLSVRPERTELSPLVCEAVESLPEAAGRTRTEVLAGATHSQVDRDRFVQVLSNLLSNAGKYSFPGTAIDVRVEPKGDMVEVCVTNEGPGIEPDELPKLFSRFGRTRSAQTGPTPGLGLGLYMSRGIVEAHGGKLWADSTPGRKTHFRFTVPKATDDVRGTSAGPTEGRERTQTPTSPAPRPQ